MFKHILFPTDGSPASEDAARGVVEYAKATGASVTAFHVKADYPRFYLSEGIISDTPSHTRFAELAEAEAQEILGFVGELCEKAGIICTKVTHTHESVHKAIIEAATQNGCDLIFMAPHGHSGVGSMLLGSETIKVLTHSAIAVLVFR